jgi:hypothetical protein
MSVNKVWNFKPLISAIIGFASILAVQNYSSPMGLSKNKGMSAVFIGILVSQVLFEMISKYEGKTCEIMDGIFTSLFAILGYFLGMTFGGVFSKIIPQSISSTLSTTPGNLTGAVFAAFALWIWKQWIRNKILPSSCAPCNKK